MTGQVDKGPIVKHEFRGVLAKGNTGLQELGKTVRKHACTFSNLVQFDVHAPIKSHAPQVHEPCADTAFEMPCLGTV